MARERTRRDGGPTRTRAPEPRDGLLDVIGIGALNVDYIGTRSRLLQLDPRLVEELRGRFEHGTERPAGAREVDEILSTIGRSFDTFLGGSAFNVIQGLAALRIGLRLGYVGVMGDAPAMGPSFADWFREH